jgi:site-specific DNA recombinase
VGPVPAGYVRKKYLLDNGKVALKVEPDPATAPTIRLIFAEYATGTYSYRSLASVLHNRGLKPPRAPHFRNGRGKRPIKHAGRADSFTADVLKDIIRNPRYAGRVPRNDGSTFEAKYEPLIDEETWNVCTPVRMRQSSAALRRTATPRPTSRYLLSGVVRCAACGSTMSGKTRRPDRTHPAERYAYTCYRQRVSDSCSRSAHIEQELLETDIRAILEAIALPDGLAKAVDAHVAAYFAEQSRESRTANLKTVEA